MAVLGGDGNKIINAWLGWYLYGLVLGDPGV